MVEVTQLFWKKLITSDGFTLGEIQSAKLNEETWQITHLYVGLTEKAAEILGFHLPFLGKVTICLPVSEVNAIREVALLKGTFENLRQLKECKL